MTDYWVSLKTIVLSGACPNCNSEEVSAITYEFDNDVWFQCKTCRWNQTYKLSDANEVGYHSNWGGDQPE
jgi:transcription elongation factor Elf1